VSRRVRILLKTVVWILCLLPLLLLAWRGFGDALGANPISFITNWLGQWSFRLLLAALALTPLRLLSGWGWPLALRRLLGLFAFAYVCLHFTVWAVVDHFFTWDQMLADLVKRRYITVGMLALLLLAPLAATSTVGMIRRLGGIRWRRLHRLVYLVGVLAALHFLWLAKAGRWDAYLYAGTLLLLLAVRVWGWARRAAARGAQG
jgi:methionine sulfoxide reductase heme-binding subunit